MKNLFFALVAVSCWECGPPNKEMKAAPKDLVQKIEELVLGEHVVGQEYVVKVNKKNSILEYYATYLGSFNTSKNRLVYYYVLSGNETPHFNSYLALYSEQEVKLGKFYIGSQGMPEIKGDDLVFDDLYGECDQTTSISFRDSIPKEIFIHCTKKEGKTYGDVYTFDTQQHP